MIKPEDLRTGNLLIYGDETKKISPSHISECYLHNEVFNDKYKPIPITPEILEKCGFIKRDYKHNDGSISKGIYEGCSRKFHIQHSRIDDLWIISMKEPSYREYNYLTEIKGFHHLQNIVYDLCSIKLEL